MSTLTMERDEKVFIIDSKGMVGSSIMRKLEKMGFTQLISAKDLGVDLLDQHSVDKFFMEQKPAYVFLVGGKVGGIFANTTYPAEFVYENLQIQNNVVHYSWRYGVKKLLFVGSSCLYPKECNQPMKEEYLLSGKIEPTNEPYAIAKIAGIKMCQAYNKQYGTNFISVIPADLYGPNDNFNPEDSHVLPALIRKFHEAKIYKYEKVIIWGTGNPQREFLYVDDFADACLFLMNNYNQSEIINVGGCTRISIRELAAMIKRVVNFNGETVFDITKPDGMPKKMLDSTKINSLGWAPKVSLEEGLEKTYKWFIEQFGKQ